MSIIQLLLATFGHFWQLAIEISTPEGGFCGWKAHANNPGKEVITAVSALLPRTVKIRLLGGAYLPKRTVKVAHNPGYSPLIPIAHCTYPLCRGSKPGYYPPFGRVGASSLVRGHLRQKWQTRVESSKCRTLSWESQSCSAK